MGSHPASGVESVLGVPAPYCRGTGASSWQVLAPYTWTRLLQREGSIPPVFPVHPTLSCGEIRAILAENIPPDSSWQFLDIHRMDIQDILVDSVVAVDPDESSLSSVPEVLHHVSHCNLTNLQHKARKQFASHVTTSTPPTRPTRPGKRTSWLRELLNIIRSIYPDTVLVWTPTAAERWRDVYSDYPPTHQDDVDATSGLSVWVPLRAVVLGASSVYLMFDQELNTLHTVIRYSPAFLNGSHAKTLFVVYQLVAIFRKLYDRNLYLGDLNLTDFTLTDTLHVKLKPDFCKLIQSQTPTTIIPELPPEIQPKPAETSSNRDSSFCDNVNGWITGSISNLDYILYLNSLSGRKFGDPNFHPVVPWVTDFTSEVLGDSLRDLTKSKFRLNKGDEALDRTFESGDHHVTAVLSEITYYTYRARRTDREVLCKYVRPTWVPEEYPRSVQRLQQWSPDEAIPELYTDPNLFRSVHHDLPDLELPSWSATPEEFVKWHRGFLESEEVSRQLHSWIDLTFGYKLSGTAAVRNKNVCLDLSEKNKDFKVRGVVQLFTTPHPPRQINRLFGWPKNLLNFLSETSHSETDDTDDENDVMPKTDGGARKIVLPADFAPVAELNSMETIHNFAVKGDVKVFQEEHRTHDHKINQHAYNVKTRSMHLLGTLVIELITPKKFRCLGEKPCLTTRYRCAVDTLLRDPRSIPHSVRNLLLSLLVTDEKKCYNVDVNDRFPVVMSVGIPLPSAEQILNPLLTSIFPTFFDPFLQTLSAVETVEQQISLLEPDNEDVCLTLTEFQVKLVARKLSPLLLDTSDEMVELVVPLYQKLLKSPLTSVLASWYLMDRMGMVLGPEKTREMFLHLIIGQYKDSNTTKHVKLYHRSFILVLIARLRLAVFLDNFINILIEALGGHKEFLGSSLPYQMDTSSKPSLGAGSDPPEPEAEAEMFAFDQWDTLASHQGKSPGLDTDIITSIAQSLRLSDRDIIDVHACTLLDKVEEKDGGKLPDNSAVQICKETLLWLSNRLGPVLTSKYITKNLLRMMSLCYTSAEGLEPTEFQFQDQMIRISPCMLAGDCLSLPVLECLNRIAELYGDHLILVQYLPYCWDLVGMCKRRVNPSLEGGLLGCLAVLHSVIPILTDTTLMKEIESIVSQILLPIIHASTSSQNIFNSGHAVRTALVHKALDVIYLLGLRIGEEMSRLHLTDLMVGFFSSFSKVHTESQKGGDPALLNTNHKDLLLTLTKKLAYSVYIAFYHLLGGAHLDTVVPNIELVKTLCRDHQASLTAVAVRPHTFRELQEALVPAATSSETSFSGSGNMIVVNSAASDGSSEGIVTETVEMISRSAGDTSRHLRGNWLAYWEHEVGRGDTDYFSLKQIRLQSWAGHQGSVRSLATLDNENSFLSGGKDRTVRLWSIRNAGEGDYVGGAQWVYYGHRKSVFSVGYLGSRSLAVSCDGVIHLWDPFVGSLVREYEAVRGGSFCVMTPQANSSCVMSANTDGNVSLIDTRGPSAVDLRVSSGIVGLVRSLCCSTDGATVAVGHSSGYISLVDLRTGKIRSGHKAHDGEVLTLTSGGDAYFVSTSLDQTAIVWQWEDGRVMTGLRAPPEPLHCVVTLGEDQVITGSTNQKVSVHHLPRERVGEGSTTTTTVSKLRSDIVKGNLIQMEVLPLNRLLLLATDLGNIHLIC